MRRAFRTFLGYAFRPFFLLGGLFAIAAMLSWLGMLHGTPWAPQAADPAAWHAHEMLFGFAGAALAGFLLTAVATWTGRTPVAGVELATLVFSWLAGRGAMLLAGSLPAAFVGLADMAFPVLLAAIASREIVSGGSRRNYGIVAAIWAFASLNGAFHLGNAGGLESGARVPLYLMAHGLLALITVIGGRIIPSFTGNWLRQRGVDPLPRSRTWVETALLPLVLATGLVDSLATPAPSPWRVLAGGLALTVAVLHAVRLSGWRGERTGAEPLVAILHLAYAWLPVGYLLLGLTSFGAGGLALPHSAALHALTAGGIATMILAVATRVALGHTGRALKAAPLTVLAYMVLTACVVVRVLSPLAPGRYALLIDVAATAWMVAFGLFLLAYWRILTGPRA